MKYILIDRAHEADIRLKNDPFPLFGRLIPTFDGQCWHHTEQLTERSEMRFPDEPYELDAHTYLGAYDGDTCVGLAVLSDYWTNYMYLDDLKVSASHRQKGIGLGLIQAALALALSKGYRGLYAICQDNNLAAARFYLKAGFEIGGFDNRVYRGTSQEHKADILFYLDGKI